MIYDFISGDRVQQFWDAYAAWARPNIREFAVLRFGDCADLAEELATQVVAWKKRATTRLILGIAIALRNFASL